MPFLLLFQKAILDVQHKLIFYVQIKIFTFLYSEDPQKKIISNKPTRDHHQSKFHPTSPTLELHLCWS